MIPRRTTSRAALLGYEDGALRLEDRVLSYLRFVGSRGAADREIEAALRVRSEANVRTRRKSLADRGLVHDSGRTRRPFKANGTSYGREAAVWVAGPSFVVRPPLGPRKPRTRTCPRCGGGGCGTDGEP